MQQACDHCGDEVVGKGYLLNEKVFCCNGCRSVYQLLADNDLGSFYQLETRGGVKPSTVNPHKYAFLEVPEISQKFIEFSDGKIHRVTLFLPEIHCSSCIFLLENIAKIQTGVIASQVNFIKREAVITFDHSIVSLAELAFFLSKIGYPPNFGNRKKEDQKRDKVFMYKLGVAGFAFGSIMLWSFPEYLGIEGENQYFRNFTSYLSLFVSIPVLFFSASDYFISAYKALKYKTLNLDVPITLGIIALYAQSVFSILNGEGPGYMDSFASFIFFLLIGKWFQNKTYKSMSFERDYTSYFPVAVTRIRDGLDEILEIEKLEVGDTILIRNEEVIPCDATLFSERAKIDYSFVTGESEVIYKEKGDFIFAGGKLIGQHVELKVVKQSNRSHLTQLWNDVRKEKKNEKRFIFQDRLSYYFLIGLLIVAAISAIVWGFVDASKITHVVVSILIVACPCALALSAPFTYGNTMRMLGRKGLYLKNTAVIERLNEVTDIVFDKTGTLTKGDAFKVDYVGDVLTIEEKSLLFSLAYSSTHPLSRAIVQKLKETGNVDFYLLNDFEELPGKGIQAQYENYTIKIGTPAFTDNNLLDKNETASYFSVGNKRGRFVFESELRDGIGRLMRDLSDYQIHVLSGDKDKDKALMELILPDKSLLHFEQTPKDKFDYIQRLQTHGKKVLMVGDGLNDAGALGNAHVGIAVSEDVFRFTPSSDAIIEGEKLKELKRLLSISNYAKKVLKYCLIFSLSYNAIGLSFAMSGNMTPLVAAILMPISSITVVLLSTLLVVSTKK